MGDGYEPYHVPQQSRRDKLRVINNNNPILFPTPPPNFYDHHHPLLIPPDLIPPSFNPSPIKEEGSTNLFLPSLMYPHQPLSNPTTTHDIYNNNNNNTYRTVLHDQSFQGHGKHVMTTTTGQSLSLSLSSHPLELNLQQQQQRSYGETPSGIAGFHGVELSRSSVPLGPFTGYASVLNGSRFLKPAQQLLEEICEVGCVYGAAAVDSGLLDPDPVENLSSQHDEALSCSSSIDVGEQTRKKSGLLSMLEEVYKRYKMYYQQVQAVIASFESVAGLSNAAPFANLALKALTKHFRRLKYAITDQLQFATKSHGKMSYERDESQRVENSGKAPYAIRSFQSTGLVDQPVWRPQRGLPERAVTVLRAWLFEHFLHPYPTDSDKLMLAKQTGLTRNQVSNWFINARVRLWKPMVEEIHTLETRQNQKNSQRDEPPPPNRPNDQMPSSSSFDQCENASTSIQRMADFSLKRNREDLAMGPTNLPYENLSHHPHLGGGVGGSGGVSNVSLTLGLHQNGVALHEAYPLNAARRFGLDSHGDGYVMTGFPTQNRPFGRDIIG